MNVAAIQAHAIANSRRWFPELHQDDFTTLVHMTLGLVGEAGEVANLVKKMNRHQHGAIEHKHVDELRTAMREELADIFAYLLNLAALLDVDLEAEWRQKTVICEQRWGDV